jgi:Fic family protein
MYVRKEAILSAEIEGTQSTLHQILAYENEVAPGVPDPDSEEVLNVIRASNWAWLQMQQGARMSDEWVLELHRQLMDGVRGADKSPGQYRKKQNWVGGTAPENATYVPPPDGQVQPLMDNLTAFIRGELGSYPPLLKAGLAHIQFESIHPFLDGNGRLGRLLVTLVLLLDGALQTPALYVSHALKQQQREYYNALQRVRTHGEWEGWLKFFLRAVQLAAETATQESVEIGDLVRRDRPRVAEQAPATGLRLYNLFLHKVLLTAEQAARALEVSHATALNNLAALQGMGLLREVTGQKRNRMWSYEEYYALLTRNL